MTNPPATRLPKALVWLRRDLRSEDHAAMHHALTHADQVACAFVFDREILDPLPRDDRRVHFLHESVTALDAQLALAARAHGVDGAGLVVRHGTAADELPRLAHALGVQLVVAAHDDDPYARRRDATVRGRLADLGIAMVTLKDHVVFERSEVVTAAGGAFAVFTPDRRRWLERLEAHGDAALARREVARHAQRLAPKPADEPTALPTLADLGFAASNLAELKLPTGEHGALALVEDFLHRIDDYDRTRDFPAVKGPSYLSVHLRFGTVSIRRLVQLAWDRARGGSRGAQTWLSELVWREFFHQILHHHPHVVERAFQPKFDALRFRHGKQADADFDAWCEGRTGYPLVDAAMRQLNQTGYMHNRLRMVAASFLVKDLGLDWRRGEAWFARQLLDFDLAANNGGWQWSASTGCDAQPWFRIFNPVTQSRRFDPQGKFIRRYLPALAALPDDAIHAPWLARPVDRDAAGVRLGIDYPMPIVDHAQARTETLARYAAASGRPPPASRAKPAPR